MNGMSRLMRNHSIATFPPLPPSAFCLLPSYFGCRLQPPDLADRDLFQPALATIVEIDHGSRDHYRAELGGEYPQAQHHRETLDRSGTQQEQEQPRDERREVG